MEFTDEQLTLLAQAAEETIAAETHGIIERYSVAITAGVSEYSFPTEIIDIKRILWKGKKLERARSVGDLIHSGSTPQTTTQGEPIEYVSTYVGVPLIKLYPNPNETLPQGTGDLWNPTVVATCLIIEVSRLPDFYSTTVRIPEFIRRQYVKDYVLYRLLKRESKMMDYKASTYFQKKFEFDLKELRVIKEQLMSCIPLEYEESPGRLRKQGRPVLPPQFGEIVE